MLFLNDVVFDWQSVVELLETRLEGDADDGDVTESGAPETVGRGVQVGHAAGTGEPSYDIACAMDFGWSGTSFPSSPSAPR